MKLATRTRSWLIAAACISVATSAVCAPALATIPPPAPGSRPVLVSAFQRVDGVLHRQPRPNGKISGRLVLPPHTWIRHLYVYSGLGKQVATIGRSGTGVFSAWVPPSNTGYAVCFDARPKLVSTCLPDVAWNGYQAAPPAEADYFPVRSGQHRNVGTAELHRGGRITGSVRNTAGDAVAARVLARSVGRPRYTDLAASAADGRYDLDRLPRSPRGWRVCFKRADSSEDNLLAACHHEAVPAGRGHPTRHIDAVLRRGGVIAGTVRSSGDRKPLDRIEVAVFNPRGRAVSSAVTDRSGRYIVNSLAASKDYRVCVAPRRNSNDFGECYRGAQWSHGDKPNGGKVAVRVAHTTHGVNLLLDHGATITGTIYHPNGEPVVHARVFAFDRSGGLESVQSGSDGSYRLRGLYPGRYYVCASKKGFQWRSGLAPACQGDVPWEGGKGPLPRDMRPMSVPAGQSVSGPDFTLSPGGSIAGLVRSADGPFLHDKVWLYDGVGDFIEKTSAKGKEGLYYLNGLLPNKNYVVCFSGLSARRKGSGGALGRRSYEGNCYEHAKWRH